MTKVKICGITNLEDAQLALELGADALGFNFFSKSPRYLTPAAAAEITGQLQNAALKVGVFVNEEIAAVARCADEAHLDAVQLHGDEGRSYIAELRRETSAKIIKAIRVRTDLDEEDLSAFDVDAVLLDAYSPNGYGGTGETFDWQRACRVRSVVPELYLAGGLTPENVRLAIRSVHPYAVDIASGVESRPGKKDPVKLKAFIANAKSE